MEIDQATLDSLVAAASAEEVSSILEGAGITVMGGDPMSPEGGDMPHMGGDMPHMGGEDGGIEVEIDLAPPMKKGKGKPKGIMDKIDAAAGKSYESK